MMQVDRENLIQDNADQAAINLSHEPELQEGWATLQEMVGISGSTLILPILH